jgi:hypothetical protein
LEEDDPLRRGDRHVALAATVNAITTKRTAVAFIVLALLVTGWSYGHALTYPGNAPWADRTVSWVRDHGGSAVVNRAEQWFYTRHQPARTPPSAVQLPGMAAPLAKSAPPVVHAPTTTTTIGLPAPTGDWQPSPRTVHGVPVMYTTTFRPDATHQGVVVGAAWMDTTLLKTTLVAGTREPGGSGWPWGAEVPPADRAGLVAAFNSGFRFRDIKGGFYAAGHTAVPLVTGDASLVVRSDGTATVGEWGRDMAMGPDVAAVRQNLHLIVDGGQPADGLATDANGNFGTRKQQLQYTWRSGVGVDRTGALVYVAGKDLTLATLASALVDVGAVRAMQLDIHTDMVTFNTYQPAATGLGATGTKLLANMAQTADRYLVPDQRDFVAMTLR